MKRIENVHYVDCTAPTDGSQKYQCEIRDEEDLLKRVEVEEFEIRESYAYMDASMPQSDIRNIYDGDGRCFIRDEEQLFCYPTTDS